MNPVPITFEHPTAVRSKSTRWSSCAFGQAFFASAEGTTAKKLAASARVFASTSGVDVKITPVHADGSSTVTSCALDAANGVVVTFTDRPDREARVAAYRQKLADRRAKALEKKRAAAPAEPAPEAPPEPAPEAPSEPDPVEARRAARRARNA